MEAWIRAFRLALSGVIQNRIRSLLTALGIVFGVAAVIAMLAIGNGAQLAIMEQLAMIGANQIVIEAEFDPEAVGEKEQESQGERKPWSPGLTMADVYAMQENVPHIERISPIMRIKAAVIYRDQLHSSKIFAINRDFFALSQLSLQLGEIFSAYAMNTGQSVCILGPKLAASLLQGKPPLGQRIKIREQWFTVVGVLESRTVAEDTKSLGLNETDHAVFVPITAALLRLENRARITRADFDENEDAPPENYHQLDQVKVQLASEREMAATAAYIQRMLHRRHNQVKDVSVIIPEVLIEQQQKTQDTFNWVLAAIAGISLLVGGIGIMNIMLASVMERIKEIGIRRSLGATQVDVIRQFLLEAMTISLLGGIIGVILGVVIALAVSYYAEIPTVISWGSILLSFGVAAAVGLLFGWYPAQKAARQDPIQALRTD